MPAAVLAALGLVAGAFALLSGDGDDKDSGGSRSRRTTTTTRYGPGEIFLELATDPGPDTFTPDVAGEAATVSTLAATTTTAPTSEGAPTTAPGTVGVVSVSGGAVGLYGGTLDDARCDAALLVSYLQQSPDKAAAWAGVLELDPARIAEYVDTLTPVILLSDTRVTNHGFAGGRATPRQSVLQAGSAVLADPQGVPRVRCRCGNPLLEPEAVEAEPNYTGAAWPGFEQAAVQVVRPAPQPVSIFVLVEVTTGAQFGRPAGTDGEADRPPPSDTASTTLPDASATTAPLGATTTSNPPAGDIPEPNADATAEGTVEATSEFSAEFTASLAVDNDLTTSWFSAGSTEAVVFRWTGAQDDLITLVRVIGNGNHPTYQSGYGFESVTVRVLDAADDVDFEETVELPGTPDPTITVGPGVEGRVVELEFSGAESASGGGFSELQVGVTR